ncbi:MAG: MliC family protein [Sphingomonadaceae bacterium]
MRRVIVMAAMLIVASGCVPKGGPGVSAFFECDRGTRLQVDVRGNIAFVKVNGAETIRLPSVASASGARYTKGTHDFWNKGDSATWTVGRMVPEQCTRVAVPR